jgi:hypothetical protein
MTTRRQFVINGVYWSAALSLAACAPPPEAPAFPDLRFSGEPPLVLVASQLEIRTLYQPTDADSAFPVPPVRALQNWARDRLRANGQGGAARFTIADATAVVKNLPVQGGISGTFTDQITQEFDVAVDAALEIFDTRGVVLRSVRITGSRSRSVLQSASANDRARARYELVRNLMSDFDSQAQARISASFGEYLLPQ